MSTFKVSCSWCHTDPRLESGGVELLIAADCSSASYRFTCPHCGASNTKNASDTVAGLLVGCEDVEVLVCAEGFNSGSIEGLIAEELAELRYELADPDAVERLTNPER